MHEEALQALQERNRRVEADTAWECSLTRRGCIAGITYVVGCLLLWSLGSPLFWLQALVPATGYVLSTLSLPWIKRRWIAARR